MPIVYQTSVPYLLLLLVDPEGRGRLAKSLLDGVEDPVGADARDLPLARVVVLLPLGRGDDEDRSLLHVELAGVDAAVALDGALEEVRLASDHIWQYLATCGHHNSLP